MRSIIVPLNNLTIDDVSVLANAILAEAQGITDGSLQVDASNFVSVAQHTLKTGYDKDNPRTEIEIRIID